MLQNNGQKNLGLLCKQGKRWRNPDFWQSGCSLDSSHLQFLG